MSHNDIQMNKAMTQGNTTPLWLASQRGHLTVMKALLGKEGIDMNRADGDGYTALMMTAYRGEKAAATMLIMAGADKDVRSTASFAGNPPGSTAQEIAERQEHGWGDELWEL